MRRSFGILLLPAALVMLGAIALADTLPGASNYDVEDSNGTHIGTASTSRGGDTLAYVDDPNTKHPPDTNGSFTLQSDGYYHDSSGYRVWFESLGNGIYGWAKIDSNGNTVDSGRLIPQ